MKPQTLARPIGDHGNLTIGLGFAFLVLATFALFFIPAFIIRPFRYQSAGALAAAMAIRQAAPVWTLLATLAALTLAVMLWRRVAVWGKVLLTLGLLLSSASAVMARVDYFEWMFHPVAAPGFVSADQAKLDAAEMVMTVRFGNDARAYPIRAMAYHHVVNDVVNGVPIAVTY
jgi:hypothetical protein